MASAFAHGIAAATMGSVFKTKRLPPRFWVLGIICSILPDADVLTFAFGVSYGDVWGHRGFSHSLVFALLLALLVTFSYFKDAAPLSGAWFRLVSYFALCTASHGLLDGMTNGGLGIAFFAPFDNTRYFLPWQPIQVSPIGIAAFFSSWGAQVLLSEMIWVAAPCLLLLAVLVGIKHARHQILVSGEE